MSLAAKPIPTPANASLHTRLGKPIYVPNTRSHLVHLSSDFADYHLNGTSANFSSSIFDPISVFDGENLLMSLYSAEIPNVLHNVTTRNNYFWLALTPFDAAVNNDHIYELITLTPGYYTGVNMANELQIQLNAAEPQTHITWVVGYTAARKFTFRATPIGARTGLNELGFMFIDFRALQADILGNGGHVAAFGANPPASPRRMLDYAAPLMGFDTLGILFPIANGWGSVGQAGVIAANSDPVNLESPNVANLYREHGIYVRSNLATDNVYSNYSNGPSNIIARVPITAAFGHIIFYQPNEGHFKSKINQQVVDSIRIELTDREGVALDLQGLAWEIALRFDVVPYEK